MRKLKKMYENLDDWLEERGEKVIAVLVLTAVAVLFISIMNIIGGFK